MRLSFIHKILLSGSVYWLSAWLSTLIAGDIAASGATDQQQTKSLWQRETLTDDWFGYGKTLRERGISFNSSITQFYQGLVSGTGPNDWKYGGKVDGFFVLTALNLGYGKAWELTGTRKLTTANRY